MCGIFGILARPGSFVDPAEVHRALNAIRHRGPDDEGFAFLDSQRNTLDCFGGADTDESLQLARVETGRDATYTAALGHRRLSILDLSSAGHQPMMSAHDTRRWMTFNGEVYNYIELRRELEGMGHRFASGTDTEVILAAYRAWGPAMLTRFVGMFAFAILDLDRRQLLIARDAFGIKPFYYTTPGGRLAFASETKALLELPDVGRSLDAAALFQYLRLGIIDAGAQSLFAEIKQLPAGHFAVIDLDAPDRVQSQAYWALRRTAPIDIPFGESVQHVRELFERSVRLHMRSDVPVGACLSGGLDSTAIVLTARGLIPSDTAFHTFTFIAEDPALSEERFVDLVTSSPGFTRHDVRPVAGDLLQDLDTFVRTQDLPFGGTSIYAQYRVFKLAAAAGMKVMLDGQGSDEMFGGYNTAVSAQLTSLLLRGRIAEAVQLARTFGIVIPNYRGRLVLSALGRIVPPWAIRMAMSAVGEALMPSWMNRLWFDARGVMAGPRMQGRGRDALREELIYSLETLSLPQLLRYEDRNSMAFSIESRVPFCIPELAEFALSLPSSQLIRPPASTKAVFREAMRGLVPDQILDRPKVGFTTPEKDWLTTLRPWIMDTVSAPFGPELGFLQREELQRFVNSALGSGGVFSSTLWRAVSVVHWSRLYGVTSD